MPKFDKPQRGSNGNGKGGDLTPRDAIPGIVEPRCHVCQSNMRKAIDRLIAAGTKYTEIGRLFGIDRRSISNHAKEHLGWEEAAIRRIIEDEARAAEEDFEEGIKGVLTRRVYANVGLKKALDALLNNEVTVEPKDALALIQYLDKLESDTEGAAIDELRVQFNAFVQAIREICPPEQWQHILDRTKELLENTIDAPALQPPPDDSR